MPTFKGPNGEIIEAPADITPQGLARMQAQYGGKLTPVGTTAPAKPVSRARTVIEARRAARMAEDEAHTTEIQKRMQGTRGNGAFAVARDNMAHNYTLGLDDVVGPAMLAATEGSVRAITKGDASQIPRTYSNARRASKRARQADNAEHPFAAGTGAVIGMVANPLGAETGTARALNAAGRVVPQVARATQAVRASRIGRGIAKVGNSAVGQGARAGFNQAAVTATMDGKAPGEILTEGGIGAVLGGTAGGLVKGAGAGVSMLQDMAPAAGTRRAYERVAKILGKAEDASGRSLTPKDVTKEIKAATRRGTPTTVGDMLPELQGAKAQLVHEGAGGYGTVAARAEARAAEAKDRFSAKVRQILRIDGPVDARAAAQNVRTARIQMGKVDFDDTVMGQQNIWNDRMDKIMADPFVQDMLPVAEKAVRSDGKPLTQVYDPGAGTNMRDVPSLYVLDQVKNALNGAIGAAKRAGDDNLARLHSASLRKLKDAIGEETNEWAAGLARQKDLFEEQASIELGQDILKRFSSKGVNDARDLADEIAKAAPKRLQEIQLGLADAIQEMGEGGVKAMRKLTSNPTKRAVLARVFGGNHRLNQFEAFMRREARGLDTDKMVAAARATPNTKKVKDDTAFGEAMADLGLAGARTGMFGPLSGVGPAIGAVKNARRASGNLSPSAKTELLKVLDGTGEGLERGVKRSEAYRRIEARRLRRIAEKAGKTPNAAFGGYVEE
jgi:hypothetical protein